jgi:hypothetical protein
MAFDELEVALELFSWLILSFGGKEGPEGLVPLFVFENGV